MVFQCPNNPQSTLDVMLTTSNPQVSLPGGFPWLEKLVWQATIAGELTGRTLIQKELGIGG